MKYYGTNKEGKKDYILKVEGFENNSGEQTYEVTFADGRKFENIEATEANIAKIMKTQEAQATEGIDNMGVFKKRRTLSGLVSGLSTIFTTAGFLSVSDAICDRLAEVDEPLINIVGVGSIVVANLIVGGYFFNKNNKIVGELERVNFRNTNRATLDKFREYPNSTVGLSKKKAEMLNATNEDEDPFNIIDLESFTTEDLEQIVSNIGTEQKFAFEYPTEQATPKTYQKK